jgi:exodeoxyribonuclease VII small subunit
MAAPKKQSEQSFEKMFSELEAVVEKLEAGDLTLDESLALFQRGMELAKQCGVMLDTAELRVKELVPNAEGNLVAVEYDEDDEE